MDDHSDEAASKLVSTRLPADLHHLVEEAARAELLTNASWIRRAILRGCARSRRGCTVPPDQIYQPIVSDDDTESETPPVSELSIVDPAEFRRKPDDEGDHLTDRGSGFSAPATA